MIASAYGIDPGEVVTNMESGMSQDLFPIMGLSYRYADDIRDLRKAGVQSVIIGIPWDVITPHEAQAQINHSQTLARLAERGGLGHCEAVAILEDRRWRSMPKAEANNRLAELVAEKSK